VEAIRDGCWVRDGAIAVGQSGVLIPSPEVRSSGEGVTLRPSSRGRSACFKYMWYSARSGSVIGGRRG